MEDRIFRGDGQELDPRTMKPMTKDNPKADTELDRIITKLMGDSMAVKASTIIGKKAKAEAKAALETLIAAQKQRWEVEARIDENRTYWWHQQKLAEKEGISKHALDRIAALDGVIGEGKS